MNSVYEYQLFYQQPKNLKRTSNEETVAYVKNDVVTLPHVLARKIMTSKNDVTGKQIS